MTPESTRVDRWLWAVRLTKTRPDAAAACRGGHVRINDRPAKPSTTVSPGDEVRARVGETTRIVEVVRVIQKRVGAADAVTCFLDRTPAPPPTAVTVPVAFRERGAGRPTKRDRRALDRWRASQAGPVLGNDVGSLDVDVWDDDAAPSERTNGIHD
ncbi:RNA-binding protein S4 [Mycobacterium antarcticum]|nr:RNA-binding protein S4 [Mycolicibacterium sp. TUM20985]GLP81047.1 RNA-binding protein S4 [Mycolicibacterium sp. TUM20984]